MFRNGGLNPFQKDRSQTPISLRYITGIELNWYKQYLLLSKGTPLLYNKVKLTKINGLFMKIGQCKVILHVYKRVIVIVYWSEYPDEVILMWIGEADYKHKA